MKLKEYTSNITKYNIFKDWCIEFLYTTQQIEVIYYTIRQNKLYKITKTYDINNKKDIIDWLIDIYYQFEYKGKPINNKTLSILCNNYQPYQCNQIKRTLNKIKKIISLYPINNNNNFNY